MSRRILAAVLSVCALSSIVEARVSGSLAPKPAEVSNTLAKLPLSFEPNYGQSGCEVQFLSRAPGYLLQLTATEMRMIVRGPSPATRRLNAPGEDGACRETEVSHALRFTWIGANPRAGTATEAVLPGTVNYLKGSDPAKWRTSIPTFERVRYQEMYPGIDLLYYGNGRQLEYDLIVAPGADPDVVRMSIEGAETVLTKSGDLDLILSDGRALQLRAPVIYQERAGEKLPIEGKYRLARKDDRSEIAFDIATYDPALPLVIDPLLYSTFLGGSGEDHGYGIAVNAAGEAFVTGFSQDAVTDFPTTPGAFDTTHNGGYYDAFVTRLNADGTAYLYSTFLGGSSYDLGYGIAVNAANEAFVTGTASEADFPTTTGAFDTTHNGLYDVFVTRLNADGTALLYSTFIGGSGYDEGRGIAVNTANEAFVTGYNAVGFPTTAGAFDTTHNGGADVFVTRLNAGGTALVYSTFLGGSATDIGYGIAVNAANEAFVTGGTFDSATDFPTTAAGFDTTHNGNSDVFVARLNTSGTELVFSTFLGGSGNDSGLGIAVNTANEAFVTGYNDVGFPTTAGAFDTIHNGSSDAFVTRLNAGGTALVFSTFLGGSSLDRGLGIAVSATDEAFVTGYTLDGATDFPSTPRGFDTVHNGSYDAFVTRLNAGGTALVDSTFLGGSYEDYGQSITVLGANQVFVTGSTRATNFPTTGGAVDTSHNGIADAFIVRIPAGCGTAPFLEYDSSSFTDGNADGNFDPNECIRFTVNVHNVCAPSATGVSATLSSPTAGVTVTQPASGYPDIPAGGTASNLDLFDVVTSPGFACGTTIDFTLDITTAEGPFTVTFSKSSGGTPGSFTAFASSDVPKPISDGAPVTSTVAVTGLSGLVNAVTVSFQADHTRVEDLNISLVSPSGTTVPLAIARGFVMDNYGSGCAPDASRTTFDDEAATAIGSAPLTSPFAVGSWRPESPLSVLSGETPNGTWTLRFIDTYPPADTGVLNCWTLNVQPLACTDGGGACGACTLPATPSITGTPSACTSAPINLWATSGYDSYQWYLEGNLITGATMETYNVASAASANAGSYTVTGTTNTCGLTSVQSDQFNVSVLQAPAAPTVTGTSAACTGTAINLSATSGYDSYQWYLGGNLIVGATSQTYSVASAASANAGSYTVTGTTNTCGLTSAHSATSAVAVPSCLITATALAVDGNGVMEAGETAGLTPSWDNDGDVTLNIVGNLSAFTGPGTSTYTISDGEGSYGSVTAGSTAAATDNYGLTVSVPATRSSVHWDASVVETPDTTPFSVNQDKSWTLHMGNSFTDVPTSYLFYREVETLLHNSVTLGCGDGTQYCKNDPTSRLAMAAFIARAELGSDAAVPVSGMVGTNSYNCSLGGNSLYTDVAPTDSFCKHVHYIATQNITAGCTGTTYCPSQNVTRLQMAIFLARAIAGSDGAVPAAYSDPVTLRSYDLPNGIRAFTDLVGNTFEKHANYLWALGISNGCTGTTYCPSALLTRGQMAKFLVGTYDLLIYKP